MTTAILAVQGAFAEHARMLERLGEDTIELRQARDLSTPFERLVLPGGESTVQAKLLAEQGMLQPLRRRIAHGLPLLATCAGVVLLADELEGDDPPARTRLACFPARVRRNAYGRQAESFTADIEFAGREKLRATFIRAPQITRLGAGVQELAAYGGTTVAARYHNQIVCTFHPELGENSAVHELLLKTPVPNGAC